MQEGSAGRQNRDPIQAAGHPTPCRRECGAGTTGLGHYLVRTPYGFTSQKRYPAVCHQHVVLVRTALVQRRLRSGPPRSRSYRPPLAQPGCVGCRNGDSRPGEVPPLSRRALTVVR